MDWGTEEVYKLISLYKKCPCLWDRTSLSYKKYNLKSKAWHKISNALKKPVLEVKRKVKNLRSCYLLEIKKVAESIRMSSSTKEVYTPHLFYFESMRFLDKIVVLHNPSLPIIVKQDTLSSGEIEFKDVELNDQLSNNMVEFSPDTNDNRCPSKENSQEDHISERSFIYEDSTEDSLTFNPIRRTKVEKDCDMKADTSRQDLDHAICSSFAKSVELQLSHLPLALATKAMADMQQILANYMGKMDRS